MLVDDIGDVSITNDGTHKFLKFKFKFSLIFFFL